MLDYYPIHLFKFSAPRFFNSPTIVFVPFRKPSNYVPRGTEALVEAWKCSRQYLDMLLEMDDMNRSSAGYASNSSVGDSSVSDVHSDNSGGIDIENGSVRKLEPQDTHSSKKMNDWPLYYKERYPGSFMYHFKLTFLRQYKLTSRDTVFIKSRLGQCVLVGAIAGSLFSNLAVTDVTTKAGFLFYVILFNAFSSFAMIPLCFDQKVVPHRFSILLIDLSYS